VASPDSAARLEGEIELALAVGGRPFEVIAGAPAARYGARITFRPSGDPCQLAAAFGLERHPWGVPSWIGVRVLAAGVRRKAYHKLNRLDDRFALPTNLPDDFYPVMASLDGDATEVYLRARSPRPWDSFAAICTAPLGGSKVSFAPRPRPAAHAFCLSFRWCNELLTAVSLYADYHALPDEQTTRAAWIAGMTESDAYAYEMALIGVRSLGQLRRGASHAMLAWTLEDNGDWHRAVSLRMPD
jgi:hypothetical protein